MFTLLRAFIYFWQHKALFLLFAAGTPALACLWVYSQPQPYKATATLQISEEALAIPSLYSYVTEENLSHLKTALVEDALLSETAVQTGIALLATNFTLQKVAPRLLKVTYRTPALSSVEGLKTALNAHLITTINALVAPERLRHATVLQELEHNLQNLNIELADVQTELARSPNAAVAPALNLKQQRLQTQLALAETKYNAHITSLPEINKDTPPKGFTNLIWLAQPTHVVTPLEPNVAIRFFLPTFVWFGVFVGLVAVLLKRIMSSGLYSNTDITKRSGLRVVGRVPNFGQINLAQGQWHRHKLPSVLPIDYTEVTRLQQILMGGKSGSLAVTATQTGEGNSLLAYLLASRCAQDGKRVLLIDLNLKNQTLTHQIGQKPQVWNLPNISNLADVSDLAIQTIPNLHVLPTPADMTTVKWLGELTNMEFLLNSLKPKYDWIVLDTTPLTVKNRNNVDPMLVTAVADHTIVALMAGETSKVKFGLSMRDLLSVGANVSGIAVNDHKNPSVKDTLMTLANAVKPLLPGLSSWLMHRAR